MSTPADQTAERQEYDLETLRKEFAALRRYAAMQSAQEDKISTQRIYIDITGEIKAALVLDEIIFWTLPHNGKSKLRIWREGVLWLAISRADWWERKRLTERQADRAINKLVEKNLIFKKVFKFQYSPTVHLRLNTPVFFELYVNKLNELHPPEFDGIPILPNGKLPNGKLPFGENKNLPFGEILNILHASPKLKEEEEGETDFSQAWIWYMNNINPGPTEHEANKIGDLCDYHSPYWFIKAGEIAVENSVRTIRYIESILQRWKTNGYGTPYKPKSNGSKKNGNGSTRLEEYAEKKGVEIG